MKECPRVSILIPCYNADRWVAGAVESALAQTWPNKEVIVIDDGSTDGSLAVIRSFGDRIRWETGPNRGGNSARNRLLELSTGEWLQYLDADDYMLPEKIAGQLAGASASPPADVLYSPMTLEYWQDGETPFRKLLKLPTERDVWALMARWELPGTHAVMLRRSALQAVGGWKNDQPCCQENELYLRLLMAKKRFNYCPDAGAIYRQWSEHTVCKRNKPEVHRRRLEIEQRAEDWLREHGELTDFRLSAINQGRFETARSAWQYDPDFAASIMRTVHRSQPGFTPAGAAAPRAYRLTYQLLGFRASEWIAGNWRKLARRLRAENSTARKSMTAN
jgi:glycosyltransferase involved in cell wall biosynthesis